MSDLDKLVFGTTMMAGLYQTQYIAGASLPDLPVSWYGYDGEVVDFSEPHTFEVKVAPVGGSEASFTKESGVTGYEILPNLVVQWDPEVEISTLEEGVYVVQFTALRTSDERVRKGLGVIEILRGIT